mmetsp:Transcript_8771/g.12891  ORF Transcript_8771/g.12891 Transcript_8771/m.12891 type:complete len:136 (+) Transcript_8771:84-491(+)
MKILFEFKDVARHCHLHAFISYSQATTFVSLSCSDPDLEDIAIPLLPETWEVHESESKTVNEIPVQEAAIGREDSCDTFETMGDYCDDDFQQQNETIRDDLFEIDDLNSFGRNKDYFACSEFLHKELTYQSYYWT